MRFVKKVKIKVLKHQSEAFELWLRKCRELYNVALEQQIEYYRKTGKHLNVYAQCAELTLLKKEFPIWKEVPNKSLFETLFRLDNAYSKFFKEKNVGFPKFKNKDTFKSVFLVKTDVRFIDSKTVRVPKIKTPLVLTENIEEGYKSAKILKERNAFYLILNYEVPDTVTYDKVNDKQLKSVGVDLGLDSLLTDSEGYKIKRYSRKSIKNYTNRVNKLNKSFSKKKKGSKRREKTKKQLNKAYLRLANSKEDYAKKQANIYAKHLKESGVELVALGDIEVKKITQKGKEKSKRYMNRSFVHNSVSAFKTTLKNKCEREGIKVYKIKENYTSKACSCCGKINESLKLSNRVYTCECNNITIDRDVNAAINMKSVWQGQFKPYSLDSHGSPSYRVVKQY